MGCCSLEGAWRRPDAPTPWSERRSPSFIFVDPRVLLELWGLSECESEKAYPQDVAGERDMQVRVWGKLKSYCTPQWFPRLVIHAMEWAVSLSHGDVRLGESIMLGYFIFG